MSAAKASVAMPEDTIKRHTRPFGGRPTVWRPPQRLKRRLWRSLHARAGIVVASTIAFRRIPPPPPPSSSSSLVVIVVKYEDDDDDVIRDHLFPSFKCATTQSGVGIRCFGRRRRKHDDDKELPKPRFVETTRRKRRWVATGGRTTRCGS